MTNTPADLSYCPWFRRSYAKNGELRREWCAATGHECLIDGPIPNRVLCTRREYLVLMEQRDQNRRATSPDVTKSPETG